MVYVTWFVHCKPRWMSFIQTIKICLCLLLCTKTWLNSFFPCSSLSAAKDKVTLVWRMLQLNEIATLCDIVFLSEQALYFLMVFKISNCSEYTNFPPYYCVNKFLAMRKCWIFFSYNSNMSAQIQIERFFNNKDLVHAHVQAPTPCLTCNFT